MIKKEDIIKSFTEEQARVYNTMMGNLDHLKSEWMLCRRMYSDFAKVVNAKDVGPEVRLLLRNFTDYWNRRRLVLERTLERIGENDVLVKWRDEANGETTK